MLASVTRFRVVLAVPLACAALACAPASSPDPSPRRDVAAALEADTVGPEAIPEPEGEAEATAPEQPEPPPYTPRPEDEVTPHQPLEFPEALGYFFEALTEVDEGSQRLVRVIHLGTSSIGADDLPAVLRERFQTRFGDGGAGLVLMSRYMANYRHRWVELKASGWDHCYIAYKCLSDGRYGLGGTAFWSSGGARTTISTRNHELGDEVATFELWYLARPGGGRVELRVDDDEPVIVDTRASQPEDRFHAIEVEPGPHKIRVRALGRGKSRLYGVLLEAEGPGLVWDQFSKLGLFARRVLWWDGEHLAGQVAHRDPDLIVLTYGGNDLRRIATGKLDGEKFIAEFTDVVAHVRRGKPEAACLITSITDHGRSLTFDIVPEQVETIVNAQREVARRSGCAFFDSYTAMGGPGSLRRWRDADPPLAARDLKHLNHRGRVRLGGWMYEAVIAAYVEHRRAQPG